MKKSKLNTLTSEVKEHSVFGGSQAQRIINCPGSVGLCKGLKGKDNPASINGTHAHACLEFILNNRDKLRTRKGRKLVINEALENPWWSEQMVDDALDALVWIASQIAPDGELFVEEKIDATKFTTKDPKKKQGSTLDIAIANYKARELVICDYKYGKYKVDVKMNDQVIYYALGMLLKLKGFSKFDRVRLVIIQPNSTGATISESTISVGACVKWGKRFRKAVKLALKPNAPLKVGEKYCFFCLAKNKCPEMKKKMMIKNLRIKIMATPKQVKAIMKKIYYHQTKLQDALDEAHIMKVINYDKDAPDSYKNLAPCAPAYECRKRITITTQEALANAMISEIRNELKKSHNGEFFYT